MTEALHAESISKNFPTSRGPLEVLRDISLQLLRGESATVMGPSGSGKSTLLNILGALEPPTSGRVTLGGRDPASMSETELAAFRNRSVGFVFQDHHLLPQCSVLENVLIPTIAERKSHDVPEALSRARMLLDRVSLADRTDHRPAELSGGERQRAAIARALINRPTLLLADEPTGNLDRASAEAVAALLLDLHREENTILLVVTHSESLARHFTRCFELADGGLVEAREQ
ncbi:MAG: ABC transporter ATP-binding protein [Phycisphaerales bacterium]|nr:MAG: ABC transporter ATP-binding protein [Phycisphaerales bacterium]